eukprot:SAG31_NODE_3940_length_3734_cov_1.934801_1_plen_209_part_00
MLGVHASNYAPAAGPAASIPEWRSHFGAWAINSSPLILSFDLRNNTMVQLLWPFIANMELDHSLSDHGCIFGKVVDRFDVHYRLKLFVHQVLAVNQAWHGHPGRQVVTPEEGWSPVGAASVWVKPVNATALAVLVVSMARPVAGKSEGELAGGTLELKRVAPALAAAPTCCTIRNLWEHRNIGRADEAKVVVIDLEPHDSAFLLLQAE